MNRQIAGNTQTDNFILFFNIVFIYTPNLLVQLESTTDTTFI